VIALTTAQMLHGIGWAGGAGIVLVGVIIGGVLRQSRPVTRLPDTEELDMPEEFRQ
jgi:hypothetical protein